ncbi:MAG: hypothetical protein K0Q99_1791 [Clostridia bacterium]|nr:hypothetical protein [Clostridia bacterium]
MYEYAFDTGRPIGAGFNAEGHCLHSLRNASLLLPYMSS